MIRIIKTLETVGHLAPLQSFGCQAPCWSRSIQANMQTCRHAEGFSLGMFTTPLVRGCSSAYSLPFGSESGHGHVVSCSLCID